ncbi:MAG TPA: hypothetical protein PK490_03980 [Prosthecobacter sp.]|nr:hypothetical protein [Prosthecobacter sp.]HRK13421.1 hypothetical protein [Prosthecobacter sp.]
MNSLLNRLESRLGRFAIPGLVQLIATLQLITLVVLMFLPVEAREPYEALLVFDRALILKGEAWRLFSYVFIPVPNLFFAFIAFMFMRFLGAGLDEGWGAFRVNLYVLGGMAALAAGALVFGFSADAMWVYLAVLFAFATLYPNEEILLFFILPVKIKWVALFSAVTVALLVFSSPVFAIPAFFALLNYLIVFTPGFVRGRLHAARVAGRRARFEGAAGDGAFFHQCKVCGKTEVDDPALQFRVNDEGDEICSVCRVKP